MVYIHEPVISKHLYSRIIADSTEELMDFVELIGMHQEWVCSEPVPHFKVYGTKLQLALSHEKIQYLTVREFENYLNGYKG